VEAIEGYASKLRIRAFLDTILHGEVNSLQLSSMKLVAVDPKTGGKSRGQIQGANTGGKYRGQRRGAKAGGSDLVPFRSAALRGVSNGSQHPCASKLRRSTSRSSKGSLIIQHA
jgi:hypothetical protein